ncbi:MAG: transcription termination factor NusA [Candidatus Portnoybacteria bacterium]|nr:transcription termination factor NusA [Candidatus Portnoybacteria bacterium]MDD4982800.1 transcription termination factor NusA [Candidatus Portnoybacteria bacterium]
MDSHQFASAIDQICEEKGISREKVLETIEVAIAAAYKKDFGHKGQNIRAVFDLATGGVKIFQVKQVLDESMVKTEEEIEAERLAAEAARERGEEIREAREDEAEGEKKVRFNEEKHIMIEDAKKIEKKIKVGEELLIGLESKTDFGRIAAQTAKQVIIQRIREAERETIFEEYKDKEGQVVSGIVQRIERGAVFVDIGKTAGVLFPEEQIQGERYRLGQRLRVLILEVQKEVRGPNIILSRAHSKMLAKLFELEVPEIASGAVQIKAIAREAGSRSKIAVAATEPGVDPIGSCVGQKGTRVQAIINELGGEKIDIIEWNEDIAKFIANALAPAKVLSVETNKEQKVAKVEVPEDQLSLAIGKRGQNVRLAAKLSEWKIDVAGGKVEGGEEEEGEKNNEGVKEHEGEIKTDKKDEGIAEKEEAKPKGKRGRKKKAEA